VPTPHAVRAAVSAPGNPLNWALHPAYQHAPQAPAQLTCMMGSGRKTTERGSISALSYTADAEDHADKQCVYKQLPCTHPPGELLLVPRLPHLGGARAAVRATQLFCGMPTLAAGPGTRLALHQLQAADVLRRCHLLHSGRHCRRHFDSALSSAWPAACLQALSGVWPGRTMFARTSGLLPASAPSWMAQGCMLWASAPQRTAAAAVVVPCKPIDVEAAAASCLLLCCPDCAQLETALLGMAS
jgi:hypothetical protein